jgi:hypothetical protein
MSLVLIGFPMLEATVVKPRVKAMSEGKLADDEIREQLENGVLKLKPSHRIVHGSQGV